MSERNAAGEVVAADGGLGTGGGAVVKCHRSRQRIVQNEIALIIDYSPFQLTDHRDH